MRKILLGMALIVLAIPVIAQLSVGPVFQKTQKLYWENGIGVTYSSETILNRHLELSFNYVTSSLGSALGTNAIPQSEVKLGADWVFNPRKALQFQAGLYTGYFMADYGDAVFDDLPQASPMMGVDLGISYTIKDIKTKLGLGFNGITGDGFTVPGTLFPLFYQMSVMIPVNLGK